MIWWELVPAVLWTVGILFIPGLVVLVAAGRPNLTSVALAPAVSVGVVAVAAVGSGLAGFRWNIVQPLAVAVLVALVALLVRRWSRDVDASAATDAAAVAGPGQRHDWIWPALGAVAGGALIARRLVLAIGDPSAIAQRFDNVFHINAVRFVVDTGSASPFGLRDFTGIGFYPLAWHDIAALVAGLAGGSVPEAVNATTLVVAAVVWPVGVVALVRQVLPRSRAAVVAAGVLSSAFGMFPFMLLNWGVLYPNFLSIALIPGWLALFLSLVRLGAERPVSRPVLEWLLLVFALGGVAYAHPNGMMSAVVLAAPLALWQAIAHLRAGRGVTGPVAVIAGIAVGMPALWYVVRPPSEQAHWSPVETTRQAIGEVLVGAQLGTPVTHVVAVLLIGGLIVLIRRAPQLWIALPFLTAGVLFAASSSFPQGALRTWLTGVWYNDSFRLAALLPIGSILVAAVAVAVLGEAVGRWAEPNQLVGERGRRRVAPVVASAGFVLLVYLSQGDAVKGVGGAVREAFQMSDVSPLITVQEKDLAERLPELTPPDARIVVNPWNGSGVAYAFSGRDVTEPHLLMEVPEDVQYLDGALENIDSDPRVCQAVRSTGVTHVLDFGTQVIVGGSAIDYSGLDELREGEHLRLVAGRGAARLFAIEGC